MLVLTGFPSQGAGKGEWQSWAGALGLSVGSGHRVLREGVFSHGRFAPKDGIGRSDRAYGVTGAGT